MIAKILLHRLKKIVNRVIIFKGGGGGKSRNGKILETFFMVYGPWHSLPNCCRII